MLLSSFCLGTDTLSLDEDATILLHSVAQLLLEGNGGVIEYTLRDTPLELSLSDQENSEVSLTTEN